MIRRMSLVGLTLAVMAGCNNAKKDDSTEDQGTPALGAAGETGSNDVAIVPTGGELSESEKEEGTANQPQAEAGKGEGSTQAGETHTQTSAHPERTQSEVSQTGSEPTAPTLPPTTPTPTPTQSGQEPQTQSGASTYPSSEQPSPTPAPGTSVEQRPTSGSEPNATNSTEQQTPSEESQPTMENQFPASESTGNHERAEGNSESVVAQRPQTGYEPTQGGVDQQGEEAGPTGTEQRPVPTPTTPAEEPSSEPSSESYQKVSKLLGQGYNAYVKAFEDHYNEAEKLFSGDADATKAVKDLGNKLENLKKINETDEKNLLKEGALIMDDLNKLHRDHDMHVADHEHEERGGLEIDADAND